MIYAGGEPQPRDMTKGNTDDDNDNGPIVGPRTDSIVELAQYPGVLFIVPFNLNLIMLPIAQGYPKLLKALAAHIEQPQLPELLWHFLYDQHNPNAEISPDDIPLNQCPMFHGQIAVYHSAVAHFFAPSIVLQQL
jgi:hypothetical protein